MREKKRSGSTNLSDRRPLTRNREKPGYPQAKPNRLKKQEQKTITMHPGFTFYFDSRGVCCYRKKRRADG